MTGMRISLVSVVWFAVTVRDTSATIVVISTESLVAAVVSGEKSTVSGSSDLWHKLAAIPSAESAPAESAQIDDAFAKQMQTGLMYDCTTVYK